MRYPPASEPRSSSATRAGSTTAPTTCSAPTGPRSASTTSRASSRRGSVTADYVYVRLHGPGGAYQGDYGQQELSGWAGAVSAWSRQGHDVYVYFDNDQGGNAPKNAASLRDMLGS